MSRASAWVPLPRFEHGVVIPIRLDDCQAPAEIAERGKKGFGVPLSAWFRGQLRPLAADLLLDATARQRGQVRPAAVKRLLDEHVSGRADHGHRLWCLVMLELWQRTWLDTAQPVEPAAAFS